MNWYEGRFELVEKLLGRDLLGARKVWVPTWHAQNVEAEPLMVSYELMNVSLACPIPSTPQEAVDLIEPQMPWAEDHFGERIGGEPLNPPPSAELWLRKHVADKHRTIEEVDGMKYSHTYPERFWPRFAADKHRLAIRNYGGPMWGIRFAYGDLADVINLLRKEPLTRQAYLPVWFPEDTGAVHGERVPCTLGYHFMIRESELNVTYMIRSVDFVRHFRDDVYLAMRLAQWIVSQLEGLRVYTGRLTMHIMSLHYFEGDRPRMEREYGEEVPTE